MRTRFIIFHHKVGFVPTRAVVEGITIVERSGIVSAQSLLRQ